MGCVDENAEVAQDFSSTKAATPTAPARPLDCSRSMGIKQRSLSLPPWIALGKLCVVNLGFYV